MYSHQDGGNELISVKNTSSGMTKSLTKESWYPQNNLMKIKLSEEFKDDFIELSLFLDGHLGYRNVIANGVKIN